MFKFYKQHKLEIEGLKEEQKTILRLFDQTVNAFVCATEQKDSMSKGYSKRIADLTKKIAAEKGLSEMECEDCYYAALLHDVGRVCLPDEMIGKEEGFSASEEELIRQKPLVGSDILTNIAEYPDLAKITRSVYEKYDGSGYPDGLKGSEIPLAARMIAVARAYDDMTSPHRTRNPYPSAFVREELVKRSGTDFDPEIADIMVKLMDAETNDNGNPEEAYAIEEELDCGTYKDHVSCGIEITETVKKISFECKISDEAEGYFSSPSIIIFDSFDRRIHADERTIKTLSYLEYAEMWFDGHNIVTGAKNIRTEISEPETGKSNTYVMYASRYEDHMKLRMISPVATVDAVIALADKTKSAYIGITGENVHITGIKIEETTDKTGAGDIPRIATETSFIDRMESDIPNVQVDRWRSSASIGIPVRDRLRVDFHSMSLPSASLVWHCPYIVLFHSADKQVRGEDYKEYAMIKLNGESDIENEYSKNKFIMKKADFFPGWEKWKEANRTGMECRLEVRKRGNKVTLITENLGMYLENITTIPDENEDIYVAITGDQVAITDIRIR